MQWTTSEAALNTLMGTGWRNVVEPALELARALHVGAADDVHAIDLSDGRVAWCSVSVRGVAICLGVEDVAGALGAAGARALSREVFFGLVPYTKRKGWRDQRDDRVRAASRVRDVVLQVGSWCLVAKRRDVSADNPMDGAAYVARVVCGAPLVVQMGEAREPETLDPDTWTARDFSKWAVQAPSLWNGRNLFSFGFACKVAGQMAWREERKRQAMSKS